MHLTHLAQIVHLYISIIILYRYYIGQQTMSCTIYGSYSYAIFGPYKVGKTSIINRFIHNDFTQPQKSTLQGIQTTHFGVDGRLFQVSIHDTTGKMYQSSIKSLWRDNKNGFIFTFSLSSLDSFNKVINQIEEIVSLKTYKDVIIILIGNKKDLCLERKVDEKTAKEKAQKYGIKYYEISAKESKKQEIDQIFYQLIERNEMKKFQSDTTQQCISQKQKSIVNFKTKFNWDPCEDSLCQLM